MNCKAFWRGDEGYEEARVGRVFNHRRPARYPVAVFFPETPGDVVTLVRFAREHNYKIAVRAGGHSWAVWSVRDEGILLDLKHLNHIEYDEQTQTVQVQPAVKGGQELRPFLQERGRLFPGGHCPTVGVGGFLLQGGQGWNARGWGWAAEYVQAVDVVTAEGELVRADATQNNDLYWAARGAGPGFFGVVVCFHLRTLPFPGAMVASTYLYPTSLGETVLKWLQEIHASVSTTVELVAIGQHVPKAAIRGDIEHLSPLDGQATLPVVIVHALAFEDSLENGLVSLAPFDTCPVLEKAYVQRTNYLTNFEEQIQLQLDANPEGHRWVVNNAWLEGTPDVVAPVITPAFTQLPNAKAFSLWYSMAPLRPLPDMAFSLQTDIYFASYVLWEDETDDEINKAWLRRIMQAIEPITAGQYLGDSDFTAHQRKFIAEANYERLEQIRNKWDPNGRFHSYLTNHTTNLNKNVFQDHVSI